MTLVTQSDNPIIIQAIDETNFAKWLETSEDYIKANLENLPIKPKAGNYRVIQKVNGEIAIVIAIINNKEYTQKDFQSVFAKLAQDLPPTNDYTFQGEIAEENMFSACLGWGLGSYTFNEYKKDAEDNDLPALLIPTNINIERIENLLSAIFLTRDLINMPALDLGPAELIDAVVNVAEEFSATVNVIEGEELEFDFPAVHAVGMGSDRDPKVVEFTWGNPDATKIALVGKGVCYDTGGYNLKPGGSMALMKKDMGGSAHVLALAYLIMSNKLNVNLHVIIPAVENSVSGKAVRPGDVIDTRSGLTVEITNTDAEGRLILSDALTLACESNPDYLIDFATLTGAAKVATGDEIATMLSNDQEFANLVIDTAEETKDAVWQLPLWQPYKRHFKSDFADMINSTKDGWGGAIKAGLFLENFVNEDTPWIHFDIMAYNTSGKPGYPVGGEAMGLQATYKAIENLAK